MASTITPCATPVRRRRHGPGISQAQHAFARHFGDIYEAPTLLRIDGEWRQVKVPQQDLLDQADLVLRGGHETVVVNSVLTELEDAGLCFTIITLGNDFPFLGVGSYAGPTSYPGDGSQAVTPPSSTSPIPSNSLYPSTSLYPGDA